MAVKNVALSLADSTADLATCEKSSCVLVQGPAGGIYAFDQGTQAWVLTSLAAQRDVRMGVAVIDFGASPAGDTAVATVAATWLTSGSRIHCEPSYLGTADHDPEDSILEEIRFMVRNRIAGVSFEIFGYAPKGTRGQHNVSWIGR